MISQNSGTSAWSFKTWRSGPLITVYENIEFGLKAAGLVKAERMEKLRPF